MAIPAEIPTPAEISQREERAILWVTCLAAFLVFNSFDSIDMPLPAIQSEFGNSRSELQWVTLLGVVTISSLSFCFGRAGGIFGQRQLYKIGVVLYTVGAGLGAISISFRQLLSARAVIACYSRLGSNSEPTVVAVALVGTGIGVFTPANQKNRRMLR